MPDFPEGVFQNVPQYTLPKIESEICINYNKDLSGQLVMPCLPMTNLYG